MFAHRIRLIGEQVSDLYWAAEVAAVHDAAVRELWQTFEDERSKSDESIVMALMRLTPLADGYDLRSASDTVTTIVSPASWRSLVRDRGWTPDEFEHWAADTLIRLLLR